MTSPGDPPLVVDLRDREIGDWSDLWDGLVGPLRLPEWFGRNLDAWWDTLGGGISPVFDYLTPVTIFVRPRGLFAPGAAGEEFVELTNSSDSARVELRDP